MPMSPHPRKEFSVAHYSLEDFQNLTESLARLSFGEIDVKEAGLFINIFSID